MGPIACSLGASDLRRRSEEIAAIGARSLVESGREGGRMLLRFRADPETRRRLEAVVAAEAECCSFLELSLTERSGELVLSIGASEGGRPVAEALAAAFGGRSRSGPSIGLAAGAAAMLGLSFALGV